jgi:hypothetical protein
MARIKTSKFGKSWRHKMLLNAARLGARAADLMKKWNGAINDVDQYSAVQCAVEAAHYARLGRPDLKDIQ